MMIRKMWPFRIMIFLGIVVFSTGLSIAEENQVVDVAAAATGPCYKTAEYAYNACIHYFLYQGQRHPSSLLIHRLHTPRGIQIHSANR